MNWKKIGWTLLILILVIEAAIIEWLLRSIKPLGKMSYNVLLLFGL